MFLLLGSGTAFACSYYQIFFDYGGSEIAEHGRITVKSAVEQFHNFPPQCRPSIRIIGFTDTAEEAEFGLDLNLRRANAVRDQFLKYGWQIERIRILKGPNHLLYQTGPNTKEPQNRRVELFYFSDVVGTKKCSDQITSCGQICWIELPDGTKCP